jgi:hypothetical protein
MVFLFCKLIFSSTKEIKTELIKDLEIIDDRDRLATGTNESHKRQRKI